MKIILKINDVWNHLSVLLEYKKYKQFQIWDKHRSHIAPDNAVDAVLAEVTGSAILKNISTNFFTQLNFLRIMYLKFFFLK